MNSKSLFIYLFIYFSSGATYRQVVLGLKVQPEVSVSEGQLNTELSTQ